MEEDVTGGGQKSKDEVAEGQSVDGQNPTELVKVEELSCQKPSFSDDPKLMPYADGLEAVPHSSNEEPKSVADGDEHIADDDEPRSVVEEQEATPSDEKSLKDDRKPPPKRQSGFVCQYCSKTFKKKASLNGHFRIHAGLIRYDCNLCSEQFSRVDDYLKHAKVHKKKEIFTCEVCSQTFVRRKKFLLHRTIHNPHVCYVCMDSFPKAEELAEHLKSHSTEIKPEEAKPCKVKPQTRTSNNRNREKYDIIFWRTCQICSNSFQKKTKYVDNQPDICELCIEKTNGLTVKSRNCRKGRQSRRKRFSSNIYFKTFNHDKTWTNHCENNEINGIESNLFHCRLCPQSFTTAEEFILHGKTHVSEGENGHLEEPAEVKVELQDPVEFDAEDVNMRMENDIDTLMNEESNKCHFCSKIFDGKKSLSLHLRTHARIYTCGFCSETFNRSDYYRNHLSKHSKDHDCDICYKTFPSVRILQQHRLLHMESQDVHWCKICKKSFSQAHLLVNHMQIHSGERPYKCDLCSKTFAQMLHLQNHYRTHNLSKNFACKLCPKTYKLSQHLTNHMKIHNNTTPYECHYCFKSFTLGNNFRNHLRTHTGEKPFVCNICQEKFGTSSQLTVHKRIHNVDALPAAVEDIYSCYFCLSSFPTQEELSIHQKTHLNDMLVPISIVIEVNPATVMGNFTETDVEEILGM